MRRDKGGGRGRPAKRTLVGVLKVGGGRRKRLMVTDEQGNTFDVAPRQGLAVFPADRVRVELSAPDWANKRRRGRERFMEATITEVLERGRSAFLGRYRTSGTRAWVTPNDWQAVDPMEVELKKGIPDGALVAVETGRNPGLVTGRIAEYWVDPDAGPALIEQIIYELDLPREFPQRVMDESFAAPDRIPKDELESREDLRGLKVVVIDPADAKDHDDAVSWEPAPDGGGRMGVHIADVSWFVRPGSALDAEAYARGVSAYLPDRVLPMLPPRLSSDLCSLLAGKDRLARTVFLDLAGDGTVRGGEMVRSVVRPTVLMSYEEVQDQLDGKKTGPYAAYLGQMMEIARAMRKKRYEAGSLDFNFPETKVELDSLGEPSGVATRAVSESNQLVEEAMIAANRFVGEALTRSGLGIWRVHEPPEMDDVLELEEFLKGLGVKLRRGAQSRNLDPRDFQEVLARFRGAREEYVIHRKVLQALRMAVYSELNLGHFGLAIKDYAHFTSPIRRYADLVVHRLTDPADVRKAVRPSLRQLGVIAKQVSGLERRAQEAEWAAVKKLTLKYLSGKMGLRLEGTVSRLERWGMFIELDGLGTDGLLHASEMGGGRFRVATDGMSMRSQQAGETIRVGQRVKVIVIRVDLREGHLDLALDEGE